MSELTPYINQGYWGPDLLRRLNNSGDENGGFNIWDELPTEGKDGTPLGEIHKGLTGILQSEERAFVCWDGFQWINLFALPFYVTGEESPTTEVSISSSAGTESFWIVDAGLSSPDFYVIESGATTLVSKYDKVSGSKTWTSNIPFFSGQIFGQVISVPADNINNIVLDDSNIYISIREFDTATPISSSVTSMTVFAVRKSDGLFLWKQRLYTNTLSSNPRLHLCKGGDHLYCVPYNRNTIYKITAGNGVLVEADFVPTISSAANRALFFDSITQEVFLYAQRDADSEIQVFSLDLVNTQSSSIPDSIEASFRLVFYEEGSIYAWGLLGSGSVVLYRYNCTTKNLTTLAELPTELYTTIASSGFLSGGKILSPDIIRWVFPVGSTLRIIDVSLTDQSVEQASLVLVGSGTFSPAINKSFDLDISGELSGFLMKENRTILGFKNGISFASQVYLGSQSSRITRLKNSFTSYNDADVREDINANSLFTSRGSIGKALVNSLRVSSNLGPSDPKEEQKSAGIHLDQYFSLYSLMGISNDALASAGYSGGRRYTSGALWGCHPINGSLISSVGSHYPGCIIFDPQLGKMFVETSAPTIAGDVVTSFPSGVGMVLANNQIGVGTPTPAHEVDVVGTLRATNLMNSGGTVTSDERIKVGILSLDGLSLWEICAELQAISFLYKPDFSFVIKEVFTDEDGNEVMTEVPQKWPLPQGIQYGWSAQQIRDYLPELVTEDPQSGILYLNREALFPIFQSAATAKIQQLEETIAEKDTLLTQLQSALESLTTRVEALENAAA